MSTKRAVLGGIVALGLAMIAMAPALSLPVQSLSTTVTVPRNSHDALAGAIAAAGPGGTVLLAPGYHYESQTVWISQPITILGDRGASLLSTSTPGTAFPIEVQPALYVWGTTGVTIKGLELRPVGESDGNTAILIENASDTLIEANFIRRFQYGVVIQHGNRTEISRNTIVVSGLWRTGAVPDAEGIMNINGQGSNIHDNRVSNGVFAVFLSDIGGRFTGNTLTNSYHGLILCRVPYGTLEIAEGYEGANSTATGWQVSNNYASGNLWGYLVIDDAHNNLMSNNAGAGNVYYDLELAGDSLRFGFPTPFSHDNSVATGAFRDFKIKNCGSSNAISGGTLVDTTTDPCF